MDMLRAILFIISGVWLIGCESGNGEGLDPNGRPESNSTSVALVAEYNSIQQNVFTPVCTVCHAGASAPLGLRLDEANSYAALVNVSSVQNSSMLRVNPSNPDTSYLIQKLQGTASVGSQMPLGGPALPQSTIDVIRQWITDGAQPASSPPPPAGQPPTVTSTNPADTNNLTSFPTSINVSFSQDMDATSFDNSSVVLRGSGGDGDFSNGNEIVITPTGINLSPATLLTINLSNIQPGDDTYQLVLKGSGAAPILDLNSNALDGNKDGVAGDDYAISFVVQSPNNAPLQATWRSIQDNIFTPSCVVCHSGGSAPEGLQLDEANSYTMLINIASEQEPSILRVAPNNANNSYLIQKLEGTAASGSQMPRGGPALSQETIDVVREWINNGASQGTNPPPPPANTNIQLTVSAPSSATNGNEFTVTATIVNNGNSDVVNLSVNLTWSPSGSVRLRNGAATQSVSTLSSGQSTTLTWTLRAEENGTTTLSGTVRDANQQQLENDSTNISITN